MGKSTISMAMFNSKQLNYQRVNPLMIKTQWLKGGPQRPLRGGRLGRWLPSGFHDVAAARRRRGVAGPAGCPVAGRRRNGLERWELSSKT